MMVLKTNDDVVVGLKEKQTQPVNLTGHKGVLI